MRQVENYLEHVEVGLRNFVASLWAHEHWRRLDHLMDETLPEDEQARKQHIEAIQKFYNNTMKCVSAIRIRKTDVN